MNLGHIPVHLHVRLADAEPVELASANVAVTGKANGARVEVDYDRKELVALLRQAADELEAQING